ncbi:MAG: DNA polymerase III subunit delta [Arachnia propionica]|nr:MAG: DNA polymerase III subunit delta [Arachnia propionica]
MSVFGSCLLVTGPEQFLAQREVAERRQVALAEQPEAQVNQVPASSLADSMLAEVVGSSLFASHVVAVIEDVGATPLEVVDQLVAVAADPGESLCLILVHEGGNKGKALITKLKKAGVEVITVATPKPSAVPDFCAAEARRLGLKLSREATHSLIDAVGRDLRSLAAALQQLRDDAETKVIDPGLIQRYFAGRAEVTSFNVADAVLQGNTPKALEQLRWALHTGAEPVLITSAVARAFRSMGKYLDVASLRLRGAEAANHVGIPPWKMRDYSSLSRYWPRSSVEAALQLIAVADAEVKGAATNPEYALERMVLQILRHRRR